MRCEFHPMHHRHLFHSKNIISHIRWLGFIAQALVSFKKYMPPSLPYFKVNIYSFPLPHFASIFVAYLWSFRWPNYIVTIMYENVMWIQWPTVPVWWQKKRYCSDMHNVVSAIDGTSHEIQIPSNEPQQKTYFQQSFLASELSIEKKKKKILDRQ
jgi:hypothetical protein